MTDNNLIRNTMSLCPECLKILPAEIFERNGKVWIKKTCEEHGEVEELYWGSYEMYKRAEGFARDGKGLENPNITADVKCPFNCGLCKEHKSHTALANMAVTNRCDLRCWYCFFFAEKAGYVYEPTLEQIKDMVKNLRSERPIPCNAVQLSLDRNEKVLIKSPNGFLISERIGEFVDKIMEENEPDIYSSPIPHERVNIKGYKVLTVDKNLKSTFSSIKSVIRHNNTDELFEIETGEGRIIKTTGSHSVFVLDGAQICAKEVRNLKENDVLIGCLTIPETSEIKEIDLLKLITKNTPELIDKIVVCDFSKEDLREYEKEFGKRINWDSINLRKYLLSRSKKGKSLRYFNSKKGKELPIKLKISPELCRLLGYYIGEGCTYRSGVIFTFSLKEKELVEDFIHCVKNIFGKTNIRRKINYGTSVQIYIEGQLYKLLFDLLKCGKSADEKQIPWIIFNVSNDLKKEFLKAYFRCDGNVKMRKSGYEVNHNTVSRDLASDLILLHTQIGIIPKIEITTSKPHLVEKTGQFISKASTKYRVVIGGKNNLLKSLWYLDGDVKNKFKNYSLSEERHAPTHLRIPISKTIEELAQKIENPDIAFLTKRIKQDKSISKENLERVVDYFSENDIDFDKNLNELSHSDIGFFRVRKIKRIKPRSEYVYDISVPGHDAFFAGLGPLLAHNTGGEPLLRDDLVDIIKIIKDGGIDHVQVNTDGIRLSQDPDLAKNIRKAGVNTIYLSFDGVTEKTNPKNHREAPGAIENCRKVGMGIVLVPTVIKSVNDHELGDIIRFGFSNMEVIRGVNFQPVSLVGRMPRKERNKYRITIPDAIQRVEEQTSGEMNKDDFYPVPSIMAFSSFIEAITKRPRYELSTHFACGMATYVFNDNGKMLPVTRFIDVSGLMEYLNEKADEIMSGKSKYWVGMKLLYKLRSFIDNEKKPAELDLAKIIYNAIIRNDYRALADFHHKSLFIGMMHFQDLYNYDIERVKRCCIHYTTPDKKMPIVPFCAFNVIPQVYRDKIQRKYALSIEEWERQTGRKLEDDFVMRKSTQENE